MPRELPDGLRNLSEEEKEQRRQRLTKESAQTRQQLEAEQEELLESLNEEHGGDLIETPVTLPGGNRATVRCVVNGDLLDRMSHIDSILADLNDGEPEPGEMSRIGESMDEASAVLADITVEAKYSKELFYEVYRRYGPEALGKHVEAAFEGIEHELKRRAGDVDGFRGE